MHQTEANSHVSKQVSNDKASRVNNFLIQYIYYPFSLGEERISKLNLDFKNLVSQFKFVYFALIPLVITTFFLLKKNKNLKENNEFIVPSIFLICVAIFIYNQLLTKKQT